MHAGAGERAAWLLQHEGVVKKMAGIKKLSSSITAIRPMMRYVEVFISEGIYGIITFSRGALQVCGVSVAQRVGVDAEMMEEAEYIVQTVVDQIGATLIKNPAACIGRHEEAYATAVVDMSALCQQLV